MYSYLSIECMVTIPVAKEGCSYARLIAAVAVLLSKIAEQLAILKAVRAM